MRRLTLAIAALELVLGGCAPVDEEPGFKSGHAFHDPIDRSEGAGQVGNAASPTSGGIGGTGADGPGESSLSTPTPPETSTLAQGIAISEIALFQGVKVTLAKGGAKNTTRTMPIIANRNGLVRVYVAPETGFTKKTITAELHLVAGGQGLPIARDTKTISGASTDADPTSTFNFEVPSSSLPGGVEYFVQLLDPTAPPVSTSTANAAQYPPTGSTESIDVVTGTNALKIVLVPVRYGADGSNRVPDTSTTVLDQLRARTLELYPVPSVDITVHAPIDHASAISANGTGWDTVLSAITQLRMSENPAKDVYYYGAFAPAATIGGYCPSGCVLGLSNLGATATDAAARASVGVLYNQSDAIGTMPHELGHAHGRRHAPCGNPAGADPSFPYADATIGVWGYGIVSKKLYNPSASTTPHDFMSYCGPEWISDYTFKGLFDRVRSLEGASYRSFVAPIARRPLRILFDRPTGAAWDSRAPVWSDETLGGEERAVTFYAADGTVIAQAVAHRYAYDHIDGGYLIVPDAPIGSTRVVVEGVGDLAAP